MAMVSSVVPTGRRMKGEEMFTERKTRGLCPLDPRWGQGPQTPRS